MKTSIFDELSEHISLRIKSTQQEWHALHWVENKAHIDYDMWLVQEGEIIIRTGNLTQEASPGDVVFFYPHQPYTAHTDSDHCQFIYIHFDFGIGEHYRILEDYQLSGIIPADLVSEEFQLMLAAHADYTSHKSLSSLRLKGCLTLLLSKIIEQFGNGIYTGTFSKHAKQKQGLPSRHLALLQPVFGYIDEHLHTPIKIESLAEIASMSEKYFITFFKKGVGITPGQYIYQLKMNRARDYLYQQKYSIKEIATLLGYPDPYTFSKAFKKYYHVAPSRFI